jgi:H+/Na+-translocating ferredoxin:NAD+ oxidoreductase subunit B
MATSTLIDQIDAILPQTQCGKCSYKGCLPYAQAIAAGDADINQCPPGGQAVISELADMLGVKAKPLNERFGSIGPPYVAKIIEEECIGCRKCIFVCPVDAILGAAKLMHTVIVSECTGCELCVAPCPVDCIVMVPEVATDDTKQLVSRKQRAALARRRYYARNDRLQREKIELADRLRRKKAELIKSTKPLSARKDTGMNR